MQNLVDEGCYEILKILKEYGKVQSSRLPELATISQSTVYDKIKVLEKTKLITSEWIIEGRRPKKFYTLTPYGKAVLEKLEELEALLQDIAKTPEKPLEEIEKEILAKKIKPTFEDEEEVRTV